MTHICATKSLVYCCSRYTYTWRRGFLLPRLALPPPTVSQRTLLYSCSKLEFFTPYSSLTYTHYTLTLYIPECTPIVACAPITHDPIPFQKACIHAHVAFATRTKLNAFLCVQQHTSSNNNNRTLLPRVHRPTGPRVHPYTLES